MKSVFASFLPLAVVLVLTVAAMKPVNGFNCEQAKQSLTSCLPFLTTNVNSPSTACCNAVSAVKASAPTKPQLRSACDCLMQAAAETPNLNIDKVIELPKLCKVDLGFPITKDFKCSIISS